MAEEPSGLSRCVVNKLIKEIRDQEYDEKANKVTIKVVIELLAGEDQGQVMLQGLWMHQEH
ncbi:hypothetical protein SLEP1_g26007 [Rubroshorea leprosula]|uniref:Uncharacterized protein n=1 Tax=Rubroshorea leprosula TaxID=152421 RepID=A0AAV5JY60_9ROSI|nr:hypothetical protein SLEP1_g26007 [Rubroshorea leprosula]